MSDDYLLRNDLLGRDRASPEIATPPIRALTVARRSADLIASWPTTLKLKMVKHFYEAVLTR
jgi:hypothetical protein